MIAYEDTCLNCPPELGCPPGGCYMRQRKVLTCDCCREERPTLYEWQGEQWCRECIWQDLELEEIE